MRRIKNQDISLSSGVFDKRRRQLLQQSFASLLAVSTGSMLSACGSSGSGGVADDGNPDPDPGPGPGPVPQPDTVSNISNLGPLQELADDNGFLLPEGFSSRVVAKTGEAPLPGGTYKWHFKPDGGATFPLPSGGWIYVSNSEAAPGEGGVGALEFDAAGNLVDAFSLLDGSSVNCAGGPTPWGTWLSCEEYDEGRVWECYPLARGDKAADRRDAMGKFQHEAAATDPETSIVYLTEDRDDSCLYRFIPDASGNLSSGTLQAAVVDNTDGDGFALEGKITDWVEIPDPDAMNFTVREQAQDLFAAKFARGEGAWFQDGVLYISTTGDGRVWAYDTVDGVLMQIYNRSDLFPADDSLNGVDNITLSAGGDVLVAEDSDDNEVQAITPDGQLVPLLRLTGHSVDGAPGEITGLAFDPSGTRLYFNSQKGTQEDFVTAGRIIGVTFEVAGPFVIPSA